MVFFPLRLDNISSIEGHRVYQSCFDSAGLIGPK